MIIDANVSNAREREVKHSFNIFPKIAIRFVLSGISTILSKCLNKKIA